MSAIPISPLDPTDELNSAEYSRVYSMWVSQGKASYVEAQAEGWLRSAVFPHGEAYGPVFLLVCSASGSTTANKTSGITGYGKVMVTKQKSHQPRGRLPKEAV